jgi:uncharacterized protein (DUF1778 family)
MEASVPHPEARQRLRKDERIYVRVTAEQQSNLQRAAAMAGKTQSQFIAEAVERAVTDTYRNVAIIELDHDASANLERLLNDASRPDRDVLARFKRAPKAVYRD